LMISSREQVLLLFVNSQAFLVIFVACFKVIIQRHHGR